LHTIFYVLHDYFLCRSFGGTKKGHISEIKSKQDVSIYSGIYQTQSTFSEENQRYSSENKIYETLENPMSSDKTDTVDRKRLMSSSNGDNMRNTSRPNFPYRNSAKRTIYDDVRRKDRCSSLMSTKKVQEDTDDINYIKFAKNKLDDVKIFREKEFLKTHAAERREKYLSDDFLLRKLCWSMLSLNLPFYDSKLLLLLLLLLATGFKNFRIDCSQQTLTMKSEFRLHACIVTDGAVGAPRCSEDSEVLIALRSSGKSETRDEESRLRGNGSANVTWVELSVESSTNKNDDSSEGSSWDTDSDIAEETDSISSLPTRQKLCPTSSPTANEDNSSQDQDQLQANETLTSRTTEVGQYNVFACFEGKIYCSNTYIKVTHNNNLVFDRLRGPTQRRRDFLKF